jgi:hypothetical protein
MPAGAGEYTLTLTSAVHPPVTGRTVTFLAFAKDYGDSGDSTAQIDFKVVDQNGNGVTGLVTEDFTLNLWNPSLAEVSGTVAVTFLDLGGGQYRAIFSAATQQGKWFLDLLTTDGDGGPNYWTPGGKQAVHKYLVATTGVVAGKPAISNAENDDTGTSGTLTLVADDAGDELFIYHRVVASGTWTLFGSSRVGSGDLQITGLLNNTMYEFMCIASRSGSPTLDPSPPSEPVRLYITDDASTLTGIHQALYDWVSTAVPWTVVWAERNAPQGVLQFVAIKAGPLAGIMEDSHSGPDATGLDTITGDREFQFTAECVGLNSPQNTGGATPAPKPMTYEMAERIASSLQKRSVLDTLTGAGISCVEVLPVQDLSEIGSVRFQTRALVEVRFRIARQVTDQLNWIDTAENPQGTYGL